MAASTSNTLQPLLPLLGRGDLTCELCDAGIATALAVQWSFRSGEVNFLGSARTVDATGGDVSAVRSAAQVTEPGEVLVVCATGVEGAVLGDRIGAILQERGASGVVVVGNVRDVPKLQAMGLTVVAAGVVPARAVQLRVGAADVALEVGAASFNPGDLFVADQNGVVVVPQAKLGELPAFVKAVKADGEG